jgi:hypothetical protein
LCFGLTNQDVMQEASDFIKIYVAEITALPAMTAEEQQAIMNESPRSRSSISCSTAGPGREGGPFVEAEDSRGYNGRIGEWLQREDGRWVLQLKPKVLPSSKTNPWR